MVKIQRVRSTYYCGRYIIRGKTGWRAKSRHARQNNCHFYFPAQLAWVFHSQRPSGPAVLTEVYPSLPGIGVVVFIAQRIQHSLFPASPFIEFHPKFSIARSRAFLFVNFFTQEKVTATTSMHLINETRTNNLDVSVERRCSPISTTLSGTPTYLLLVEVLVDIPPPRVCRGSR